MAVSTEFGERPHLAMKIHNYILSLLLPGQIDSNLVKIVLPKGKGKLCVVHKRGVGHVKRGGSSQAWSGQQDVGVVEDEEQVVEHGLLVLPGRAAEVAKEATAGDDHLAR